MSGYEWYWLVVSLTTFFVLFLPAEIMALTDDKPKGTLSETVWDILYPRPDHRAYRYRRWIRIGFTMAFVWLFGHFVTAGWF